jgi:microcompartment protein CcmL/EutN
MVALDVMEKQTGVRVVQAEINDFLGIVIKIAGQIDQVHGALQAGFEVADRMGGRPVANAINRPSERAGGALISPAEFNPLIQQDVVHLPQYESLDKESSVAKQTPDALGFIETQGFTAVFEAIDTACKAADVQVVGKEKLGGGYVTVIVQGDVAAVNAAIDAGQQKVASLGNLIAAHVVTRPSPAVLALLPS